MGIFSPHTGRPLAIWAYSHPTPAGPWPYLSFVNKWVAAYVDGADGYVEYVKWYINDRAPVAMRKKIAGTFLELWRRTYLRRFNKAYLRNYAQ